MSRNEEKTGSVDLELGDNTRDLERVEEIESSNECEVTLYYWDTCSFPIPQLGEFFCCLLSAFHLLPQKCAVARDFLASTGHISMEIQYDKSPTGYQRAYYISLVPAENKKFCYVIIPETAMMNGRNKDLGERVSKNRLAKKVTIKGLDFKKMKEEIVKIFGKNYHRLNKKRAWSIIDGVWTEQKQRQEPLEDSKDEIGVLSIDYDDKHPEKDKGLRWGLIKNCCNKNVHSCSTIINDILVAGGLKVSACTRVINILQSLVLLTLAALLAAAPTLCDFFSDHDIDNPKFNLGFGISFGYYLIMLLYQHGLLLDECFCCDKTSIIRPLSIIRKAEKAEESEVTKYASCWYSCFQKNPSEYKHEPRKSNFPLRHAAGPLNSDEPAHDKYKDHVCHPERI